ncbi:WD40 repeat-like protein [Ascodesmis nigricans]|uniref:WD40 repeat-like protein n=1 Tax=Ascodesmis nigricans TaxID=341454 RepID=A0A4S2MXD4_9PEZI|nr:WD40 repeat-like protein [Ascodesmis nigricans]
MGSPASKLSPEERHRRQALFREHLDRNDGLDRMAVFNPGSSRTIGLGSGSSTTAYVNQRTFSSGAVGVFGMGVGGTAAGGGAARHRLRPDIQRTPSSAREINGNIFAKKESAEVAKKRHETMLSVALEVDRTRKVFEFGDKDGTGWLGAGLRIGENRVKDAVWDKIFDPPSDKKKDLTRHVPTTPFRVLDAPGLRDDYYCSLIAYSPTTHSLAVGLHSDVYNWNESCGAQQFESWSSSHVTCLAFSSKDGKNNILGIGRIDGSLTFWTPGEPVPRLEQTHSAGVACIAWKPKVVVKSPGRGCYEDVLVGDEMGIVHIYRLDWNTPPGQATMALLRRLHIHTQQICGLAWSTDGSQFITGGNDNMACLFDTDAVLTPQGHHNLDAGLGDCGERYRWAHGAAVKAIAFCPWQRSLVATGGGSNDRGIHFYHTFSGQHLKTINVAAQVTSLIWSTTRREIAATFGFSNPDHPIRIAVFAWPECTQIVSIPWQEEMRALYAVYYPGGPAISEGSGSAPKKDYDSEDEEGEIRTLLSRASPGTKPNGTRPWGEAGVGGKKEKQKKRACEGCIVVAASDETVRFHEVWSEEPRGVLGWRGVLGGSDILEELEGIESEGNDVIR